MIFFGFKANSQVIKFDTVVGMNYSELIPKKIYDSLPNATRMYCRFYNNGKDSCTIYFDIRYDIGGSDFRCIYYGYYLLTYSYYQEWKEDNNYAFTYVSINEALKLIK